MTAEQCRRARQRLNMTQNTLAKLAGVPVQAVSRFESAGHLPQPMFGTVNRHEAIQKTFEEAGIEFGNT